MPTSTETLPPDVVQDDTPDEAMQEAINEAVEKSFRLARFVAVVAIDPVKREFFLDHPDLAMNDAGLDETERSLVMTDEFQNLCLYFVEVSKKPTEPETQPPPAGLAT